MKRNGEHTQVSGGVRKEDPGWPDRSVNRSPLRDDDPNLPSTHTRSAPQFHKKDSQVLGEKLKGLGVGPEFRLKHYEVIRALGEGGMGKVFLARDLRLGRLVALKFVLPSQGWGPQAFIKEARATAQLNHDNIVTLHDVDEIEGLPYMVLEHLEGETLATWHKAYQARNKGSESGPAQVSA